MSSNNEKLELTILCNLIYNEEYIRKVLPFLKEDYFADFNERTIFLAVKDFVEKYNKPPTKESILIDLEKERNINEEQYGAIKEIINDFKKSEVDLDWLKDTTEKFCKDKAVHNAILSGIHILDSKDKKRTPDSIPELLREALAVSFDTTIGHDYIADSEKRFDYYHKKEDKIQFDLDYFNRITKGGVPKKTLNICLAGVGVGKSLVMCHFASSFISQGKSVLYITLEMAEERIAERIDANLLNMSMDDIHDLPKKMYDNKINDMMKKVSGQLIIKEYPTASAHTGHFRALINELALKKSFKPDVLFVDYLNICSSSRFSGGNISSYFYIKAIAEELRGLAVEFNMPIFSATQTTRTGFVSTDIGLEDTSESFGLPATADFMFAIISSEQLEALNQIRVKQLKNRYNDPTMNRSFILGVDRGKMKLYDVEQKAQLVNTTEKDEVDETEVYNKFTDFKI